MEKKEAIREWCIDVAASVTAIGRVKPIPISELIKEAEKLEEYIAK